MVQYIFKVFLVLSILIILFDYKLVILKVFESILLFLGLFVKRGDGHVVSHLSVRVRSLCGATSVQNTSSHFFEFAEIVDSEDVSIPETLSVELDLILLDLILDVLILPH